MELQRSITWCFSQLIPITDLNIYRDSQEHINVCRYLINHEAKLAKKYISSMLQKQISIHNFVHNTTYHTMINMKYHTYNHK